MVKVTVVIPNYNGIKFMEACLEALLAQNPDTPAFQVVVVIMAPRTAAQS